MTLTGEKHLPVLVSIGERRLAVRTAGEGVPAVVLEMGLGSPASTYTAIAEQIAAFTHVLWYDRAGLGYSDPAPVPRTVQDLAEDLHALLQNVALPGPFVLAGHSIGGHIVRLYRDRYPEEVAALVLIDPSHEDQRERYLTVLPPQPNSCPALAHLRHIWESRWVDPRQNEEHIDNLACSALLRACHPLGDLPLIVLSRGQPTRNPARYPAGVIKAMEQLWCQMQQELAHLSSQGRHLVATKSGHLIHEDEPALIVEVIQHMLMHVREQMQP
ncbi:MAG TPA: alpha/beta hydrolase [Ktedonobacteraceae bacterium]